jgi:hypothetical protein
MGIHIGIEFLDILEFILSKIINHSQLFSRTSQKIDVMSEKCCYINLLNKDFLHAKAHSLLHSQSLERVIDTS